MQTENKSPARAAAGLESPAGADRDEGAELVALIEHATGKARTAAARDPLTLGKARTYLDRDPAGFKDLCDRLAPLGVDARWWRRQVAAAPPAAPVVPSVSASPRGDGWRRAASAPVAPPEENLSPGAALTPVAAPPAKAAAGWRTPAPMTPALAGAPADGNDAPAGDLGGVVDLEAFDGSGGVVDLEAPVEPVDLAPAELGPRATSPATTRNDPPRTPPKPTEPTVRTPAELDPAGAVGLVVRARSRRPAPKPADLEAEAVQPGTTSARFDDPDDVSDEAMVRRDEESRSALARYFVSASAALDRGDRDAAARLAGPGSSPPLDAPGEVERVLLAIAKGREPSAEALAADPLLTGVWGLIADADLPVVIHCGSGPTPGRFTGPEPVAEVLAQFPSLRLIVAHMGTTEYLDFLDLAERYENVGLDTTMSFTDFAEADSPYPRDALPRVEALGDKVFWGSDYPNIPYPYAHGIESLIRLGLGDAWLRKVLYTNAAQLFGV